LLDIVVCDSAPVLLVTAPGRNGLVAGDLLGVLGDYVPRVQEAGDVAQNAEENVYEGVGGAEAGFYPYCVSVMLALGIRRM
jgi:hypothetical protein